MEIRSKRKFYELWRAGVLGNRTLLFDTVWEALEWRPRLNRIGFREIGKPRGAAGAWTLANREDAVAVYTEWKAAGRTFIMDGSVPNHRATLQGELVRTEAGLTGFLCERRRISTRDWLEYAREQCNPHVVAFTEDPCLAGLPPMRKTMAMGWHRHTSYLETRLLLDRYMDPSSRDDVDALLDLYPDAAIEFTAFSVNVGLFPGRNVVFWETRNY